ncbi:hypothetical protein [Pseudomonas phage PPAT]|nr:hypothetical protein [Pseudomonas phage PPAT]
MQTIGHQRQRAEHAAADDLNGHHQGTQDDHRPGLALVLLVPGTQEHVVMAAGERRVVEIAHNRLT